MKKLNIKVLSLFVAAAGMFASCSEELTKAEVDAQNAITAESLPVITDITVENVGAFDANLNINIKGDFESMLEFNINYANNEAMEGAKTFSLTGGDLMDMIPDSVEVDKAEGYTFNITMTGLAQNTEYYLTADAYVRGYEPIVCEKKVQLTTLNVYNHYADGVYSCGLFGQAWEQPMEAYILNDTVYRLPDYIAPGYDLNFTWNAETGYSSAVNTTWETGYIHASYGMIDATCYGVEYDAETKTFTFLVEYTCAAGSFGGFYDTFTITE